MTDAEFDAALIAAAMIDAAAVGWRDMSIARAARAANLDLARARTRVQGPRAVLLRLGVIADRAALTDGGIAPAGTVNERLFDLLMRRIDVLQSHRAGVLALLRALPADPGAALLLAMATASSMRWMLDAAGVPTGGAMGALRVKGLVGVWLWTIRGWRSDDSPDLSATMATLDAALARAAQLARSLGLERTPVSTSAAVMDAAPDADAFAATPGSHSAA